MKYASVCSGIEVASVAWRNLGWRLQFVSELDPYCCSLLEQRYPRVPNLGDMTKIGEENGPVDLLVGGTPCQSFSVAGKRGGLDDPRGNLAIEFALLARRLRARWVVWENVPGVLSSGGGGDFGAFLGALAGVGYGFAYRILDAQYFGVPQRRRRVFVVGYFGDWRPAAAVLFERASMQRYTPPRRNSRTTASALTASGIGVGGPDLEHARAGHLIPMGIDGGDIGFALRANPSRSGDKGDGGMNTTTVVNMPTQDPVGSICARDWKGADNIYTEEGKVIPVFPAEPVCVTGSVTHTLRAEGCDASEDGTGRGTPIIAFDPLAQGSAYSHIDRKGPAQLRATSPDAVLAFQERGRKGGPNLEYQEDVAYALTAPDGGGRRQEKNVMVYPQVRRLTPRECERLQGLPDDYTAVLHKGKPADDTPRYKALGNAFAAPVVRWIGHRIDIVEEIMADVRERDDVYDDAA